MPGQDQGAVQMCAPHSGVVVRVETLERHAEKTDVRLEAGEQRIDMLEAGKVQNETNIENLLKIVTITSDNIDKSIKATSENLNKSIEATNENFRQMIRDLKWIVGISLMCATVALTLLQILKGSGVI